MERYTEEIQQYISIHANKENQEPMEKYMRNKFPFLGIRKTQLLTLLKSFLHSYGKPEEMVKITDEIWNLPEREFQYIALEFLGKDAKRAEEERIDFYEKLILTKSWWDTVDTLSSKCISVHFMKYPHLIAPYTSKWMEADNIWLKRTAIIFQLKYKEKTDVDLLFSYIEKCLDSKEFFIQKAIGWSLREYGKTNPELVREFVKNHQLAPLSRREALKHIEE